MQDRIEKHIDLQAPLARVWRAVTDHKEFGQWFRVKLDGPFKEGELSTGYITHPGYEHLKWNATVVAIKPERLFSLRWCPNAIDPDVDYSNEPTTLVEFRLEPISTGTHLVITESGFNSLPNDQRREEAFLRNTEGWAAQAENITAHVHS